MKEIKDGSKVFGKFGDDFNESSPKISFTSRSVSWFHFLSRLSSSRFSLSVSLSLSSLPLSLLSLSFNDQDLRVIRFLNTNIILNSTSGCFRTFEVETWTVFEVERRGPHFSILRTKFERKKSECQLVTGLQTCLSLTLSLTLSHSHPHAVRFLKSREKRCVFISCVVWIPMI